MFFERKRMLKKEAAGWEGPAAKKDVIFKVRISLSALMRILGEMKLFR